jgi:rSAM/selenodomain-associated transferase 1
LSRVRIVVFARAPVPGRVKTRLQLDPAAACRLHESMTRAVLATASLWGEVELSTDGVTGAWPDHNGPRSVQCAGDLGARMLDAFRRTLEAGFTCALVLGSDAPTLPAAHIGALLASDSDVTLGPTEDGGYWGIACRKIAAAMFDGVEWSSSRTLETTVAAVKCAGLTVALGPEWWDVDGPADLARLGDWTPY